MKKYGSYFYPSLTARGKRDKKNEMTKEGQEDADSILEFANNNVYAAVARCGSRKRTSHDF